MGPEMAADHALRSRPLTAVAVGGLVAGVLDITDAIVATLIAGGSPARMLRYIASGLLGQSSFEGGWATALLGLVCHFTIALGAATVYVLASRRLPVLLRRPFLCGLAYGLVVLIVMRNVVLPLSAVRMAATAMPWPQMTNQTLIHMFGVGLPIALAARRWMEQPADPRGNGARPVRRSGRGEGETAPASATGDLRPTP